MVPPFAVGGSEGEVSTEQGGGWWHPDQVNEAHHQAEVTVCREGQSQDRWEGQRAQLDEAPKHPASL